MQQDVSSTASYVRDTIAVIGNTVAPDPEPDLEESIQVVSSGEKSSEEKKDVDESSEDADIIENLALKAKQKLSSFIGTIADAFVISRIYDDDDAEIMLSENVSVPVERWRTLLKAVQVDPLTYCHEPGN